jgi:xanthine dehydrogenase accessory factor
VAALFAAMRADGVPESFLSSIHAPVGVSIGSHAPEEIAISIAAEIIRERNSRA